MRQSFKFQLIDVLPELNVRIFHVVRQKFFNTSFKNCGITKLQEQT